MSVELKRRVDAKLTEMIATATRVFGADALQGMARPRVVYEKRGRTAGTANYTTNTIDLNLPMLERHADEMINDTLPHEYAHLLSYRIHGTATGRGHGPAWKSVMVALGQAPERCHSMDTEGLEGVKNKNKYVYRCRCGKAITVGPVIHRNVQRGRQYRSRCCGVDLSAMSVTDAGRVSYTEARKAASTPPAPKTAPAAPNATGGTKLSRCWEEYKSARLQPRPEIIKRFVGLGCTPAGAATYYSMCLKKWESGER